MIRDQIDREGKRGRVADKSIDDTSFAVCASKSKEEVDIWGASLLGNGEKLMIFSRVSEIEVI